MGIRLISLMGTEYTSLRHDRNVSILDHLSRLSFPDTVYSLLSRVHKLQTSRYELARRCISTSPNPFPERECLSIKYKISLSSSCRTDGRAWSNSRISRRFFKLPQASSPITKGWIRISKDSREFSRSGIPVLK